MIKKLLYFFIFLFLLSIAYLSYFGISTNKFNSKIENTIQESYPKINVKLTTVKVLLDILELKINLETKNPIILVDKEKIKLSRISTEYNIKSFFNKEFAINNLFLVFEKNKVKNFIKLIRANKDTPQLFVLDKIVKDGDVSLLRAKFFFDESGKLKKDDYEIKAKFNNLSLELLNKTEIKNLSATLIYNHNNIKLFNIGYNLLGLKFLSDNINISKKKEKFLVKGEIECSENRIPQEILSVLSKYNNIENAILSFKSDFSFNISKKFDTSDLKINSKVNLKEVKFNYDNKYIKKYLPNFDNNFKFSNHIINININNNNNILEGSGKFQIGDQIDKIRYNLDFNDEKINYDLNFDLNEMPIQIDQINFSKKENIKAKLRVVGKNHNKKIKLKKISFKTQDSNFILDNIEFTKNYRIANFEQIKLNYFDNENKKNDLLIINNKKNNYLISGNNFNLSKIIDDTLFNENDEPVKIFDKKNRVFKVDFSENYIDKEHYLIKLKGQFQIKNNNLYDLNMDSKFVNNKKISLSIKTVNNNKVTTFYSDFAKPFVKKYKFIKGFEEGKIDFSSNNKNKITNSKLKIYDFKLKELPALTKILTLASLQGIADILSGEGVRFDEFEMSFKSKKDLMEIQEIYAIGPAISILMDGYVQGDELISLRGTLVPATTINKFVGSIPILGDILVGKKTGEGVFGVSFKIKGPPKDLKTTVNPIKTLTPRFITRTLEKIKKAN